MDGPAARTPVGEVRAEGRVHVGRRANGAEHRLGGGELVHLRGLVHELRGLVGDGVAGKGVHLGGRRGGEGLRGVVLHRVADDRTCGGDGLRHKGHALELGDALGLHGLEGQVGGAHDGAALEVDGALAGEQVRRGARHDGVPLHGEHGGVGRVRLAAVDGRAALERIDGVHLGARVPELLGHHGAHAAAPVNEDLAALELEVEDGLDRADDAVRGRCVGAHAVVLEGSEDVRRALRERSHVVR
mmetsp:Transcript_24078/g.80924  ORF Transcript_24078/g.80924 Transcript_24078/m.80924 type:complete len:244 (+) Transcript_24078:1727-2458(+)